MDCYPVIVVFLENSKFVLKINTFIIIYLAIYINIKCSIPSTGKTALSLYVSLSTHVHAAKHLAIPHAHKVTALCGDARGVVVAGVVWVVVGVVWIVVVGVVEVVVGVFVGAVWIIFVGVFVVVVVVEVEVKRFSAVVVVVDGKWVWGCSNTRIYVNM